LSYLGAEPTYATAIATLRRIFRVELERMHDELPGAHAAAGEAAIVGGSGDGSLRRDQN
jgi:hypothetical protein